jgi:hypothetical protein
MSSPQTVTHKEGFMPNQLVPEDDFIRYELVKIILQNSTTQITDINTDDIRKKLDSLVNAIRNRPAEKEQG